MRATMALLCLFFGSPSEAASDNLDVAHELKVERYRTLLSGLSFSDLPEATMAPTDLPEDLNEIIEAWVSRQ